MAGEFLSSEMIAYALGLISTFCFAVQYIPQTILNYRRKSVKGFSTTGILLKHIGACFLAVNSMLLGEPFPVILYGVTNVIQHSVFMIQFARYENNRAFYRWLAMPLLPLVLGYLLPDSIPFTNLIKPISQVVSHFPQLYECWKIGTCSGISTVSQYLNLTGGLMGFYMCLLVAPKAFTTYIIYANSIFQASSLFGLTAYFGELFPWQTKYKQQSETLPGPV